MRIGLVAQWLRAAVEDLAGRRTALRSAAGISIVQVGWVLRLVLSEAGVLSWSTQLLFFVCLVVLELAVPRWAERRRPTNWHPHHIAERYGLSTIILLGESVLAEQQSSRRRDVGAGDKGSHVAQWCSSTSSSRRTSRSASAAGSCPRLSAT